MVEFGNEFCTRKHGNVLRLRILAETSNGLASWDGTGIGISKNPKRNEIRLTETSTPHRGVFRVEEEHKVKSLHMNEMTCPRKLNMIVRRTA